MRGIWCPDTTIDAEICGANHGNSAVSWNAPAGLAPNGTRLRCKCFEHCHLRLGHDPCRLARQVNESCERSDVCETILDPCQLVWQVNQSCERSGVYTPSSGYYGILCHCQQNSFTCQTSWQGSRKIRRVVTSLTKLVHLPDKLTGVRPRRGREDVFRLSEQTASRMGSWGTSRNHATLFADT